MSVGYWRSTAIAMIACLQLAIGTVQAAEKTYTANDLLQACKDSLLERAAFPRPFYSGLCMGLVAGVSYMDAKSCAPENATNNQLIRVVLEYIEVRPQRMNEEFMKLVVRHCAVLGLVKLPEAARLSSIHRIGVCNICLRLAGLKALQGLERRSPIAGAHQHSSIPASRRRSSRS